jgi:hypothetical protein
MIIAIVIVSYLLSVFISWLAVRSFLKTDPSFADATFIVLCFVPIVNLIGGFICWGFTLEEIDCGNFSRKFFKL